MFYGAAEFSRDTDLLILADLENISKLKAALEQLKACRIAVPPLELEYLQRGHAVHFRCEHPEAASLRIDVMAKLREGDSFEAMWERRTSFDAVGSSYELLSLPDLVRSKKTQRSKDWPMLRRLVESNYLRNRQQPTPVQQEFWLKELRTPELLVEAASLWPSVAEQQISARPALKPAAAGDAQAVRSALDNEEKAEREKDRVYWAPLKIELERLRHAEMRSKQAPGA